MTSIVPFHIALRDSRKHLGFSRSEASERLCLTASEYDDLELHEDEWREVVPAYVIRFAVSIFGIDWRNTYAWPQGGSVEAVLPLNEFLRSVREAHGLSREEFADRVGYFGVLTDIIEGDSDGLVLSPLCVAIDLAQAFGIKATSLVECVLQPHVAFDRIVAKRRGA